MDIYQTYIDYIYNSFIYIDFIGLEHIYLITLGIDFHMGHS